MEAFFYSVGTIALAELGDKTQLLCFLLASHYRKPFILTLALIVGSLISHFLASLIGSKLGEFISNELIVNYIAAIIFVAMGILVLLEKDEEDKQNINNTTKSTFGIFLSASIIFTLSEIGDKTMLATMALSAKYNEILSIVIGSVIGMMIVNVPVIYAGDFITKYISINTIKKFSGISFIIIGIIITAFTLFNLKSI
ncbi:TMEM165/GDT1 family protein [Rickettsiales endosymbiont of Stachyamoeba lipophora]|uniref:TMEM165/GDT1 family protein n=1 Tax=Rickettsiales endosymbiont of Stachyamoeba lipophora TaxID=2486578 RepID=UPI000F649B57|nr:TMEM165/GDT1 family protein [Rickettsiales endosymbiont of Stachyamoeba lipophora]AZL16204.1 TMEM165/GDT1 family protein [Rickettsiales endosymbiont of Stachyamoeba lipophora]